MNGFTNLFTSCCFPKSNNDREYIYNLEKNQTLKGKEPKDNSDKIELYNLVRNSKRNLDSIERQQSIISYVSYPNIEKEKEKEQECNKKNINNINDDSFFMIFKCQEKGIPEDEIIQSSILVIEEVEGGMFGGQKLYINACGLINGGREMADGLTLFGTQIENDNIKLNDFELNISCKEDYNFGSHIFFIYYKRDTKSYYIRSYLGKNFNSLALLVKINKVFFIKRRELICIGDVIFQIYPNDNGTIEIDKLPTTSSPDFKKYTYNNSNCPITIGRDRNCKIVFLNDKSFSRIQTCITYDFILNVWTIQDGYNSKPSTNGTWVYALHSFEIINNTVFRLLNSKFEISVRDKI